MNIDRSAINEMNEAESNGEFDFIPNLDPSSIISNDIYQSRVGMSEQSADNNNCPIISRQSLIDTIGCGQETISTLSKEQPLQQQKISPTLKRKNSLEDFELEIEGINLDENIDISVIFLLHIFYKF